MSDVEPTSYNTVYETLVQRDDDLVGLIAYALYKQHKRDWLIAHHQKLGRSPSEQELGAYLTAQKLDSTVVMYRERATTVLENFGDAILSRATPDIAREAITSEITSALKWWRQIPTGIATALAYTLLLIAIALVLRYAGIDVLSVVATTGRS